MKSKLHFSALLRIASTGAMLAALAAQPALAADARTTNVKLRIGVAITETLGTGDGCPLPYVGQISGSGYSTELGAVRIQATDCVIPTDGTFTSFGFFTKPDTIVRLTTLSGDEVWGTYSGTATGAPFPIEAISAELKITGGTGRYVNARGDATIEGIENIGVVPAVGVLVISGKLSY